ncbi:peptidoglycan-binding [Chlorella sorokiniana]|uniref:Peptidoglycan-binding n=1 Tax=Chlorella sorokiniana TaxID=3076 RepID=A0A2P6TMP5_CHLSO|nr:peptidoglycan-binding [Chlorella sorokiniana]|eukprot:PRW45585.1 peptidoglycan-binding [Chlorella sorokiniana]
MRGAALLLALLLSAGSTASAANYDTLCTTYVVASGDSLWSIANKFAILQDDLEAALESCLSGWSTSTALQVGQKICLPGYVPACDYVVDSGGSSQCKAYQVQQGDTLTLIASVFGIYSGDLVSLNSDVANSVLQVGTFVRLPPWASTCPDPDSGAASCRVYAVQQGDFVYGIASMFRVTLANLLAVNTGLTTDTVLQASVLSSPPTTGVFDCRAYRVKTGDSLSAIALLFQITVNDLVAVNPELSDPSLLTPGKSIRIPPFTDACINGILIDPSNTAAAATPSSSTTDYSTVPTTSPSPSPSPVAASPSPPIVIASPSPSTTTAAAPSTGVYVKLSLTGTSVTAVTAKASMLAASMASILGVSPASWVSVTAAASRRRLQATATTTSVTITAPSASPAAMAAKAHSAASSITSAFASQGFAVAANSLAVTTFPTVAASPSPSPSPAAASPSPAATPSATSATSSSSGGSSTGAIVGGVVGGVGGVCVVAVLTWLVMRKRSQAAAASSYVYPAGVTATVQTNSGLPSVKTGRARVLREDQGASSSPRNTVTPRTAHLGQVA